MIKSLYVTKTNFQQSAGEEGFFLRGLRKSHQGGGEKKVWSLLQKQEFQMRLSGIFRWKGIGRAFFAAGANEALLWR